MRRLLSRLFWRFVESRVASNGKVICDVAYLEDAAVLYAAASSGFYSPLVDREELSGRDEAFWSQPSPCLGVDLNHAGQAALLQGALPELVRDFDYPLTGPQDELLTSYYVGNTQFSGVDARMLFGLLRLWRPKRIIEVGSGYSTLLMTDVVRRFLSGNTRITAIEPFPRPFLHRLAGDGFKLLQAKVQDVDPAVFAELGAGDVLFIDSSHVAKTGSDVNHLLFEVLPRLAPGVHIHFHDIFLPFEYPRNWVIDEHRSWNEQYLLRALLMYSAQTLQVTLSSAYVATYLRELAGPIVQPGEGRGGSLWLTRLH